jgi:PST family polysaccharide transporter
MTDPAADSKRRILRTSSILGASSLAGVILSIARMKLAALTIGPAGVGLIGLFQNVVALAASLGGLGIANAAPRAVAVERSQRGKHGEAAVGRAVMVASAILASFAGLICFLLRVPIAAYAFGDSRLAADVGWLALAVAAGVMVASQSAVLAAFGRIGDVGRANLVAGLLATIIAVPIFLLSGRMAPLLFVVSAGVTGCAVGFRYVAKLPIGNSSPLQFAVLKPLMQLGLAISAAGVISLLSQLLVRRMVSEHFGIVGLGAFQASWALASVYLMLVLQAMSADFYPRLSEASADQAAFNRLINEQTEVAILLGGPVIVVALGTAPLLVSLFYGNAFADAASIFRWQLAGDVLRIASWPFGFAILAQNKRGSYFVCEAIAWAVFAVASAWCLPRMGLTGVGVGYAVMYLAYLPIAWTALRLHVRVHWSGRVAFDFLALLVAAALLLSLPTYDRRLGLITGIVLFVILSYQAFRRLRHVAPGFLKL